MVVYCFISCIKAYLSAVFFKHKYNILEHPRGGKLFSKGGKCPPAPPKINPDHVAMITYNTYCVDVV